MKLIKYASSFTLIIVGVVLGYAALGQAAAAEGVTVMALYNLRGAGIGAMLSHAPALFSLSVLTAIAGCVAFMITRKEPRRNG